ncbi:MAG: hypothetical protein OXD01_02620 [Gammaproteobacteria bacterium]|nr:hypothetical protein [Gammaproteobacteria bacterium]
MLIDENVRKEYEEYEESEASEAASGVYEIYILALRIRALSRWLGIFSSGKSGMADRDNQLMGLIDRTVDEGLEAIRLNNPETIRCANDSLADWCELLELARSRGEGKGLDGGNDDENTD